MNTLNHLSPIGFLPLPDCFKYASVFQAGKPCHSPSGEFLLRHPPMDPIRRSKLFSPFDALKGFSGRLGEQTRQSTAAVRREPSPDQQAELERTLRLLSILGKAGDIPLQITWFEEELPARFDENGDPFGCFFSCCAPAHLSGDSLLLDGKRIPLSRITDLSLC